MVEEFQASCGGGYDKAVQMVLLDCSWLAVVVLRRARDDSTVRERNLSLSLKPRISEVLLTSLFDKDTRNWASRSSLLVSCARSLIYEF